MKNKNKLYVILLSLVIVSSLFILNSIENKEENGLQILTESNLLVKELKIDILMLRRSEKDFLLRKKFKYISNFNKNFLLIRTNIDKLLKDLNYETIDTKLLFKFDNSINTYSVSFLKLIEKQLIYGLNENEGKHFELRKTAHKLLKHTEFNTKLFSDILQLRRHEKDFISRKNLKYKDLFIKKIDLILLNLVDIKNKQLLIEYKKKFILLAEIQEEIGLNENIGLMGEMRKGIHISESILETLSKQLIQEIDAKSLELTRLTDMFIMALFIIVIFVITILVKYFIGESKIDELNLLNNELSKTLNNLETTQEKLIESEKMASLGGLVAGVAHEINTPLGIALTGITYFDEISQNIHRSYQSENMTQENFEEYLSDSKNISNQVLNNIKRASDLVQSFKQVSVDQTSEVKREFFVKEYTDEILLSIHNQLKRTNIIIENNIPNDIKINSYPGAFGQILTNLILNSVIHAYKDKDQGIISLTLKKENNNIIIHYKDDGKGIKEKDLPHIFEPFFTTKRGLGGTGLGLNILYNIVRKQFDGEITCKSKINEGVNFEIIFPNV